MRHGLLNANQSIQKLVVSCDSFVNLHRCVFSSHGNRSCGSSSIPPHPLKVAGSEAVAAAVGSVPADSSVVVAGAECALRSSVVAAGAERAIRSYLFCSCGWRGVRPRSVAGAGCAHALLAVL
jgi:hypothetical protein